MNNLLKKTKMISRFNKAEKLYDYITGRVKEMGSSDKHFLDLLNEMADFLKEGVKGPILFELATGEIKDSKFFLYCVALIMFLFEEEGYIKFVDQKDKQVEEILKDFIKT